MSCCIAVVCRPPEFGVQVCVLRTSASAIAGSAGASVTFICTNATSYTMH
jgi:hypothetical protein